MSAHRAQATGRILVIDDEPDCTFELVEHLEMNGLACTGMTDPRAALELFRQDSTIAVVVSDIKMPGMDGITLVREISTSCGDQRPVALILVTGHAGMNEARQALDLDGVEFILKPIDLDDLDRAIARGFQRLDIQRIESAGLAVLRARRRGAAAAPARKPGEPFANSAGFAAMIEAIGTTLGDMGSAENTDVPAQFTARAVEPGQDTTIELMALARQLAEQHATTINRRSLRLIFQPDNDVLAWGRAAIVEAALARLISGFILASIEGAEVELAVTMADGRACLSIRSSAIAPASGQASGQALADASENLELDLGLAALWTHEAAGALELAVAGTDGLVVTIALPAAS